MSRGLTPYEALRTPARSKALKAGPFNWRHLRKQVVGGAAKRHEGNGHRRDGTAATEGKPLKGESRTWLRGEINLQGQGRSKPSRE